MSEQIEWSEDTQKMWQGLKLLDIITKLKESEESTKHSIRCHDFVCSGHVCGKYHEWSLAEILDKLLRDSELVCNHCAKPMSICECEECTERTHNE